MTLAQVQRMIIEPEPEAWRGLAQDHFTALDPEARSFRVQLGLPTDRPLIMTGHQATFWHPGVLSKYLAAQAAGEVFGFEVAHLVADQDIHEHDPLLAPVRNPRNRLEAIGTILMGCAGSHVATSSCPAFDPQEPALGELVYALPSVERGMGAIVKALQDNRGEPNAARQISRAAQALIAPHLQARPSIFATQLALTELFHSLVERLRTSHRGAIDLYNEAARAFADADITPLATGDPDRGDELPLWSLVRGVPRHRVHLRDLDDPDLTLAPRAILMSGLIRLGACDLFIVGTGGELYDRVTERWFDRWLGRDLAPRVTVTADLLLPLQESDLNERDVARAVWRAHSARHNPSIIGLASQSIEKRRLVEAIDQAHARDENAGPHFRALHDWLEQYRTGQAEALRGLHDESVETANRLGERAIARDRTWAFPLYESSALVSLGEAIEHRFVGATSSCGAH